MVRDASCTGLRLTLARRLQPGSLLIVRLRERFLSAQVVYTTRQESHWVAGCKLHAPLSEAELGHGDEARV